MKIKQQQQQQQQMIVDKTVNIDLIIVILCFFLSFLF